LESHESHRAFPINREIVRDPRPGCLSKIAHLKTLGRFAAQLLNDMGHGASDRGTTGARSGCSHTPPFALVRCRTMRSAGRQRQTPDPPEHRPEQVASQVTVGQQEPFLFQVFWRRAFRKAGLPLISGRHQKDLNLDSSCLFRKRAGISRPNRTRKPACLPQAATRAAVFCKVEFATSKFRTSGVPLTTFARAFSTSG
jgi:hypothetical protein